MNIRKRLKAVFSRPERKLTVVIPELRELCQDFHRVTECMDTLRGIVEFFDIMSRWYDRGIGDLIAAFERVNYGQYDEVLEKMRTLQKHFGNAGRDQYGMNRTVRGQRVTEDDVFLGNIYGLFTKPVSYWKHENKEPKSTLSFHPEMKTWNAYDIVCRQARQFMKSHAEPMIAIINDLEAIAA